MSTLLARFIAPENQEENPDTEADRGLDSDPELPPDPPPSPTSGASFSLLPNVASGKVTPALKKRISAEIEAYIEMAALPLVMSDPHCGTALHEQAKPMAEAIAQILSRYPDVAHKFMAAGVFGDWLKLLIATRPVVMAIYSHHIAPQPLETPDDAPDFPPNFDPFRPGS